jgi:hypothetical protein
MFAVVDYVEIRRSADAVDFGVCCDTYLKLDAAEEQAFKAAVDTMGLDEREEVMEIVTSWEQRAIERVAVNLLREGMAIEAIALLHGVIGGTGAFITGTACRLVINIEFAKIENLRWEGANRWARI